MPTFLDILCLEKYRSVPFELAEGVLVFSCGTSGVFKGDSNVLAQTYGCDKVACNE